MEFILMDIHKIGEFLEKVADLSESVYWLSSPDLKKIIYVSPAYEKIWGRSRQELYDNSEKWITYLHPDDVKNYHPIHALAERIKTEKSAARYNESYRIIRPNGEVRYILDRGFPIFIDDVCQGITGFAVDITENKLAEDEFKKITYQLEGAKLISGSIAHEIRTPLATIKSAMQGMSHTLSKLISINKFAYDNKLAIDTVSEGEITDMQNAVAAVNRKVDQSNMIINMLLTKLQSVNFKFSEFSICSASHCIQNAITDFVVPDNMLDKITFNKNNDFEFLGSQTLIMHVIMNLLKNAIYYIMKAGKGEITIWLEPHKKINEIHFKDTGSGISPQVLPHIFDSFFTTASSTGTGVGLAFSKMVMQSHEGAIECQSKEGEYTEFVLSFPMLDK